MTQTGKTLMWLGILVALALLVWAMMDTPARENLAPTADSTEMEVSTAPEGAATGNGSSQFASELSTFDRTADSIDFDSDFSTSDLDAAMNAQ